MTKYAFSYIGFLMLSAVSQFGAVYVWALVFLQTQGHWLSVGLCLAGLPIVTWLTALQVDKLWSTPLEIWSEKISAATARLRSYRRQTAGPRQPNHHV